jgi:hypothetical protein
MQSVTVARYVGSVVNGFGANKPLRQLIGHLLCIAGLRCLRQAPQ